jgi:Cu(I)/Ag(I) efflux system membrane protein CusA/SilA
MNGPIAKIIELSARNRLVVLVVIACACAYAASLLERMPLDALPDLSDTQVIIYSRWDRSPDIIEDQVTYPIVSGLLGAPNVKAIRGLSDFGYSFVYVIFQDGTDLYWARSRVLEYLSKIQPRLPESVETELGPDASGVGWIFQYALHDPENRHALFELRSFQDWTLRYALQSVPGVAEVASFGGYQEQYQVTIDPNRLMAYQLTFAEVADAVRRSNDEVGGRLLEFGGTEFMVRGRGYLRSPADLKQMVLRSTTAGVPVRLGDLAQITRGPDLRRGVADLDGRGDVVGGIVVMRHGENALNVSQGIRARLEELRPSLPSGVEVLTTYDRAELITRALTTLRHELWIEMIVVALVILLFLWHFPSSIVPIVTIPVSVLLSFIPLYLMGITVNIMSLAGIAISIGVLVDGAIVEVENAYNRIYLWQKSGKVGDFFTVRLRALQEVGPSVFFSLLVIAVSFLPVFVLVEQEGRLFKPLAWSKTLAMGLAALLAITLDPALRMLFSRIEPFTFRPRWLAGLVTRVAVGRYVAEEQHPIARRLMRWYEPICRWTLRRPLIVLAGAALLVASSIPALRSMGSEFMPPLNEGSVLFMPTTLPGISIGEAAELMQRQDRVLTAFPEVEHVHGKAGRAETSTDPAPLSMMETVLTLKPESQWRGRQRWWSGSIPESLAWLVRPWWPDRISHEELVTQLDQALRIPGVTNAWTMPIKARTDMLSTGIRTPIGIKVLGADLNAIQALGVQLEELLQQVPGTRSVFAERVTGGYFVDIEPQRERLARYGLTVDDVQRAVLGAIGGESLSTVIAGRARYAVNLRYPRELRDRLDRLERVLIATKTGSAVPLGQVSTIGTRSGPAMIRNENGFLAGYVFVDIAGRDLGGYVEEAKRLVAEHVRLPAGTVLLWSGQYENMQRVRERLQLVVPITLGLIFLLLLANTGSVFKASLVLTAVPFSAIGAIWLFWALDYSLSIAAWIGILALFGLDAETGVFMLMFLDHAVAEARRSASGLTRATLDDALIHGAVKRLRPKLMTVTAAFCGLLPILWSTAAGADVMKRIAAPMIGGLVTSFLLELLVYPAAYKLWISRRLKS